MAERPSLERVARRAVGLARKVPTPFYLYDRRVAASRARLWRRIAARAGVVEVFYPYKCNRHVALLDLVAREGLGAEVTSPFDLKSAISRGLPGDRLVFQGPAKDRDSIDRMLGCGARIVADGPEDALAILARGRDLGMPPRYLLRLRAAAAEPEQRRFGMSAKEIVDLARRLTSEGAPLPEGLAFHLGTGISTAAPYVASVREAGRLAARLRQLGLVTATLDAGGGFAAEGESRRDARGRPRKTGPSPETIVRSLVVEAARALPGVRILLQPGRALASDAFHLVTRVLRVRGRCVYVDASRMSHALFVPRGRHAFLPIPFRGEYSVRCQIAGPLPVELDVLSRGEAVGRPRVGDLLLIGSVGAYNLIAMNEWAGQKPPVVELEA